VLCKLARGNDETHAAIAPTALRRHTTSVLSSRAALRQLRRLAPAQLPENPCGLSAGATMPDCPAELSFIVIRQPHPTTSAAGCQSPRSPDIGSHAENVSKQVGSDPEWRNPSHRPPRASIMQ